MITISRYKLDRNKYKLGIAYKKRNMTYHSADDTIKKYIMLQFFMFNHAINCTFKRK